MITIELKVNNEPIKTIQVKNVSENFGKRYGEGGQIYQLEDGRRLTHNFNDGIVELAIKTLKLFKNEKIKE